MTRTSCSDWSISGSAALNWAFFAARNLKPSVASSVPHSSEIDISRRNTRCPCTRMQRVSPVPSSRLHACSHTPALHFRGSRYHRDVPESLPMNSPASEIVGVGNFEPPEADPTVERYRRIAMSPVHHRSKCHPTFFHLQDRKTFRRLVKTVRLALWPTSRPCRQTRPHLSLPHRAHAVRFHPLRRTNAPRPCSNALDPSSGNDDPLLSIAPIPLKIAYAARSRDRARFPSSSSPETDSTEPPVARLGNVSHAQTHLQADKKENDSILEVQNSVLRDRIPLF